MNASHSPLTEPIRSSAHPARETLGKIAYALLFTVVLPLLLFAWATALDRSVPLPRIAAPEYGAMLVIAGAALMIWAVLELRWRGGGWPMSPYPPEQLVTTGAYALLAHPLYAGAVLLAAGVSIACGLAAGAWIVAPVLAAACIAFVWGFEQQRTRDLLGDRTMPPLIHLPGHAGTATASDRISTYILALLAWYVVYAAINRLATPADAFPVPMRVDDTIAVHGWTELIYFATYPLVLIAPLIARSSYALHDLIIRAWVAIAGASACYLAVPTVFEKKPIPSGTLFSPMLEFERAFHAPNTALPAFHVMWVMLVAAVYVERWPRLRPFVWPVVLATAASCLTTGMHAVADVLAGLAFGLFAVRIDRVWHAMVRASEFLSNGFREWRVGAMRLINYGVFGGLAAGAGLALIIGFGGESLRGSILVVAASSIAGAALWAQIVEGSPSLLRPYGYYGSVIGALLAIAAVAALRGEGWPLLGAFTVAAPFIQAIGRLRCMLQGCCHGRPTDSIYGIVVIHPKSRVVRLAHLEGVAIHPTPLYSVAANAVFGVLLVRLANAGAPLSFIAGAYFVLAGLERFVEEHYRGEPQTRAFAGLRLYQWLAIASVVFGAILSSFPSHASSGWIGVTPPTAAIATVFGVLAYFAYGADFPESNRRFARLA